MKDLKVKLTDGTEFTMEDTRASIDEGGVLRLSQGDDVDLYAPHAWTHVEFTRSRGRGRGGVTTG